MLQFLNVSAQVLYDMQTIENRFLTLINACISHELRNPLNSVMAQNFEQKALLNSLKEMI